VAPFVARGGGERGARGEVLIGDAPVVLQDGEQAAVGGVDRISVVHDASGWF
jgi:hypothetical protein